MLTSHDVETVDCGTAAECLELLKDADLRLHGARSVAAGRLRLFAAGNTEPGGSLCVPAGDRLYWPRSLGRRRTALRRYSKSIIIKGAKSPERLLDEVTLFLHQVVSELPDEQQKMIRKAQNRDAMLEGRRILVVEDDVRNVYALTNILEPRGAIIEIARNGREALDALEEVCGPSQARQSIWC